MKHLIKTARSRLMFSFSMIWMGACAAMLAPSAAAQTGAWLTHSHDEQHTALSTVQSQPLNTIHWHARVDLFPPGGEIFIHYGSPLVTQANTVIVPVKTGTNSFRVEAHNGTTASGSGRRAPAIRRRALASSPLLGQPFRVISFSFPTLPAGCW
jgi:hypothetical protein